MPLLIGTSGWQYRHWKERFYAGPVVQKRWLEHYAERFQTVEVNNSFYMLPKPETFRAWAERTPDDFVVAVKMNRYVTHIKRLREAGESVDRFMEHARHLGSKLGPVLVQLPPTLKVDLPALQEVLGCFTSDVRVSVEFRHDSWYTPEVRAELERRNAALCLADRVSKPITPVWKTASWGFVRFHHGIGRPIPCYRQRDLDEWADRIAGLWSDDQDVFVFFNNDPEGCAIRDARLFAESGRKVGLTPSRVPGPHETPVG